MEHLKICISEHAAASCRKAADMFRRILLERCGAFLTVVTGERPCVPSNGPTVRLETDPGLGPEAFRIAEDVRNDMRIIGGDARGVLYGIGKFLRTCYYREGSLELSRWRGVSAPAKPWRTAYFATHFHNWYHDAPLEDVAHYVEELALWGYNAVAVWFDAHHYRGLDDPAAVQMIERLRGIFKAANAVGLGAVLYIVGNEAYADSPEELRADWTCGHDGYTRALFSYHLELCPHKPGALDLMLKWREELLSAFADIRIEYVGIGSHDPGGCTCASCKPWGANGFLKIAERTAHLCRQRIPGVKIILGTWDFDYFTQGEWAGLAAAFQDRPDWVDYILADGYVGEYPRYPLEHGVPGGLPLVGFPEISMYGADPWGGFGANPFPARLQHYWDRVGSSLKGGSPYSEGIYDDINMAVCSRLYWGDLSVDDALREYIAFEFAPEVSEPAREAIRVLESTLLRSRQETPAGFQYTLANPAGAERAFALMREANARLPARAQTCWRWRLLYLRAQIDADLVRFSGRISDEGEAALRELVSIYHAENAEPMVRPPAGAIAAVAKGKGYGQA